jgi:hypothetical protein
MKPDTPTFIQLEQAKLELTEWYGRLHTLQHLRLTAETQYYISRAVVIVSLPLALLPQISSLALIVALLMSALTFRTYRLVGQLSDEIEQCQQDVEAKQAEIRAILKQLAL